MAKIGRPGPVLELADAARTTLVELMRHHPKPYLRKRGSALLKVADGQSLPAVAATGLLRRRHPDTVSEWVRRYLAQGVGALSIRGGRRRKPVFSPLGARRGDGADPPVGGRA